MCSISSQQSVVYNGFAMKTSVIVVPYDSGHFRKRMGCGPERIVEGGLKNLFAPTHLEFESENIALESSHPAEIAAAFELARKIADRVWQARSRSEFPIVLSGNCNAAIGTVSGCGSEKTGIMWFDAHGEAMTPETTVSGFFDGMPISTLLGRAWQAIAKTVPHFAPIPGDHLVLFGASQLDEPERGLLDSAGVRRLDTVDELKELFTDSFQDIEEVYVHVDLDVLDRSEAIANQWAGPNGISLRTLLEAIAEVRRHTKIAALGIGSYDPAVDEGGRALAAALRVVETVLSKQ